LPRMLGLGSWQEFGKLKQVEGPSGALRGAGPGRQRGEEVISVSDSAGNQDSKSR